MGSTASKTKNALEDDRAEELASEIRAEDPAVCGAVIRLTDGAAPHRALRLGTLSLNIKDQEGTEQVTEGLKSVWNIETGGDECMRADDETNVSVNVEEGQFQSEMYNGGTTAAAQLVGQKHQSSFRETMRADDETLTTLSAEHGRLEADGTNNTLAAGAGALIQKQQEGGTLLRAPPGAAAAAEDAGGMKEKMNQPASENGVHDDESKNSDKEKSCVSPAATAAGTSNMADGGNDDKQVNNNLIDKHAEVDPTEKGSEAAAGPSGTSSDRPAVSPEAGASTSGNRPSSTSGDRKKRQISEQCSTTLSDISELDQEDDFPPDSPASCASGGNTAEGTEDCPSPDSADTIMAAGGSDKDSNRDDNEDKTEMSTTEPETTGNTPKKPVKESIMSSSFKEFLGMFKIRKKSKGRDSVDQEESQQSETSEQSAGEGVDAEAAAGEETREEDDVKRVACNENVIVTMMGLQAQGGQLKEQLGAGDMVAISSLAAAVRSFQVHQDEETTSDNLQVHQDGEETTSDNLQVHQDRDGITDEKLQGQQDDNETISDNLRVNKDQTDERLQVHQDNAETTDKNQFAAVRGSKTDDADQHLTLNGDQDILSAETQRQNGSALENEILEEKSGSGNAASNSDATELGEGEKGTQDLGDGHSESTRSLRGKKDGQQASKPSAEFSEDDNSGTHSNHAREGQNSTLEQENILNGMTSAEDGLQSSASLQKSLDDNDNTREGNSLECTSRVKSMKRMPSVDRGEETMMGSKTLKLQLCGKVMSVQQEDNNGGQQAASPGQETTQQNQGCQQAASPGQETTQQNQGCQQATSPGQETTQQNQGCQQPTDPGQETTQQNQGGQQPTSPGQETEVDDKEAAVSSTSARLMRMSASSAEDSGIGSITAGSPTEGGDMNGKRRDASSQEGTGISDGDQNSASPQSEVIMGSEEIALDCKAAPKTGFPYPDAESGHGVGTENTMYNRDEEVIEAVKLDTSEPSTLDCKAGPKIGFKYPYDPNDQGGSNTENQISTKDVNVIKPESLETSEAVASECQAGPRTGFKYSDSLDSESGRVSREISVDSETAMGDVESLASADLSRRDSIDSEAELRSFEQDESISEMESGDLIDELGIMYDDTATWGVAETGLEMRQDDRGVMMSDDEESDDEVFIDEGISSGQSQDEKRSGSSTKDGHTSKTRKVKFRSKNITVGWKAMKLLSAECVPDGEGLEGKLQESASKMTKLLQDAEAAHRADSPDVEGAQAKVTLQAYGLKIGDKVMVGGVKTGVLRFCGPTEFASGIWAGIELDEAAGKNDGSVGGVSYFKCSPKHGIFAPVSKISRPGILTNRGNTPRKAVNYAHVDTSKVTAKVDTGLHRARSARSGSGVPPEDSLLEAGERVLVAGQRRGVVRFSGEADFAPGWWYGIELDRPVGKNDGSVNGKRYFTCKPKYGVFAPPSRIQKLSDLPDAGECLEAVAERQKRLAGGTGSGSQPALNTSATKTRGPTRQEGYSEASKIPTTPRRSLPKSSGSAGMRRPMPPPTTSGGEFRLQEGTSVFCNNELGVIRFMGAVQFAEGIWLGVELRTSKGKNDGSVGGTRYFTCRPNHGLLVRPSKVTVRGINGAKLMGNLETPEADKKDVSY